jgi:hypothetical protein
MMSRLTGEFHDRRLLRKRSQCQQQDQRFEHSANRPDPPLLYIPLDFSGVQRLPQGDKSSK